MRKKILVISLFFVLLFLVLLVSLVYLIGRKPPTDLTVTTNLPAATGQVLTGKSVEEIIKENAEEMKKGVEDQTSSNPFDYIDEECFDNIAALGFDAIEVLGEEQSTVGLNSYISGLLIEKITRCDLGSWESGIQFFQLWNGYISMIPEELSVLVSNKDMAGNDKVEKIRTYGIFGEAFLKDFLRNGENSRLFCDVGKKPDLTEEEREQLQTLLISDSAEIEKAFVYLIKKNKLQE